MTARASEAPIPGPPSSLTARRPGAAHIFDRFYKTDKSRGLDKSGVGLGLYICKTIIDAHGEEIHLATHTDGCEFWFTLKEGASVIKQHRLN